MSLDHDVVPEVIAPGDPRSGDEALPPPARLLDFVRHGGDPAVHDAAVHDFHALWLAILAGDRPWDDPALTRLGALLRIDGPLTHDTRPARIAEVVVADEVFADVTEDLVPELALLVERVTGDDRPVDVVSAAVLCFAPVFEDDRRPLDWWFDEELDRPLARSGNIVAEAPPSLFRDGVPLLPLAAPRIPTGPAPAGVYVARAYLVGDVWAWSAVLPLPRVPDAAVLLRRLRLELWRQRLTNRFTTFEDMLRACPTVVYRAACEGAM